MPASTRYLNIKELQVSKVHLASEQEVIVISDEEKLVTRGRVMF